MPGLGQPAPIWQRGAGAGNCWEALPTQIFLASFEEEEEEQEASTASTQEGFCVASFFFFRGLLCCGQSLAAFIYQHRWVL